MEPENINVEIQEEVAEVKQNSSLHKVTPLSKYLAMLLFILLPFIGGWIGYNYALEKVVDVERVVIVEETTKSSLIENTSSGDLDTPSDESDVAEFDPNDYSYTNQQNKGEYVYEFTYPAYLACDIDEADLERCVPENAVYVSDYYHDGKERSLKTRIIDHKVGSNIILSVGYDNMSDDTHLSDRWVEIARFISKNSTLYEVNKFMFYGDWEAVLDASAPFSDDSRFPVYGNGGSGLGSVYIEYDKELEYPIIHGIGTSDKPDQAGFKIDRPIYISNLGS